MSLLLKHPDPTLVVLAPSMLVDIVAVTEVLRTLGAVKLA
jgi:hypothetical protein